MMARFRPRFTYANVMATVAVFLALGGGAYAVTAIPKNSVGTPQLKNNAVISAKVKDNSLTGADVNEAKLGRVPSAKNALNAGNAAKLGGLAANTYQQAGAKIASAAHAD